MESLLDLYAHTDIWLLIFCRLIATITMLPIVLETKVPALAVGGIITTLTMIVFFTVPFEVVGYTGSLISYTLLLIKEILVGTAIGFSMLIFFQIFNWTGQLLSNQGGLSMSTFYDPTTASQIPLLGRLFTLSFSMVFILSGGYHWFIVALVKTFEYLPIGSAMFNPEIVGTILDAVAMFFEIGFKLSAPLVGVILIVDVGLGVLARAAPQMNMFVIGLPLKLLLMLTMLIVLVNIMPFYFDLVIELLRNNFFNVLKGLMPTPY
ncbi:MAG: flagellar biosynthetic protein FliR [Epulopiscium sp. Nuni2H_MBin001]|nr:MAG: flagellar biosynthetic protein FliR [Epulopiscium sp. Nuni2H_MBin001]